MKVFPAIHTFNPQEDSYIFRVKVWLQQKPAQFMVHYQQKYGHVTH